MSEETRFLTEQHFIDNLSFHQTDLFRDWKNFLHLFVQRNPKCPDHPDIELKKEFVEMEEDGKKMGVWKGTLECPQGDYKEVWTFPTIVNIWDWADELRSYIQTTQVESVQEGYDLEEQMIQEVIGELMAGKKVNLNRQNDVNPEIWTTLGALEQTWSAWLSFQELVEARKEEAQQKIADIRNSQAKLFQERGDKWKQWLSHLMQQSGEVQQAWRQWGEKVGWVVLEHEGIPTPRRYEELLKEAPKEMTIEAMEAWFHWTNTSRDYMNGLRTVEESIGEITQQLNDEEAVLREYYFDFPYRGESKNRGKREAIGYPGTLMERPGLFVFTDDMDEAQREAYTQEGYEKMEDLMENPEEVMNGQTEEEREAMPEDLMTLGRKQDLMKQYAMQDIDTTAEMMEGAGLEQQERRGELDATNENLLEQPEHETTDTEGNENENIQRQ